MIFIIGNIKLANKSCDIDVDKIDYIQDSYYLGISHTGELNRLVKQVRINKTDKGEEIIDKKLELIFIHYSQIDTDFINKYINIILFA